MGKNQAIQFNAATTERRINLPTHNANLICLKAVCRIVYTWIMGQKKWQKMTKSDLFLYISCNFCTFPSIFERFSTPFLPFSPVSTISRMAFQPAINDFAQKSQKKLAQIAENPQYFKTFIIFNTYHQSWICSQMGW